jgi:hypothetical protein
MDAKCVTEVDNDEVMIVPHCIPNNALNRNRKPTAFLIWMIICGVPNRAWTGKRLEGLKTCSRSLLVVNPYLQSLLKGSSIVHATLPRPHCQQGRQCLEVPDRRPYAN